MGDVKRDESVERGDSLIGAYPWRTMCYEHIFYPPTQTWGRGRYVLQWGCLGVRHECSAVRDAVVWDLTPALRIWREREGTGPGDQYRLGLYPWRTIRAKGLSVTLERVHTCIHLRFYEGALECPTKERHGISTEQDTSLGRHHTTKRLSSAQSPGYGGGPTASLCMVLPRVQVFGLD